MKKTQAHTSVDNRRAYIYKPTYIPVPKSVYVTAIGIVLFLAALIYLISKE